MAVSPIGPLDSSLVHPLLGRPVQAVVLKDSRPGYRWATLSCYDFGRRVPTNPRNFIHLAALDRDDEHQSKLRT